MTDGAELLALFPTADLNWIAWTPEGLYDGSPNGGQQLLWQLNKGWDAAAVTVPATEFPSAHRPGILPRVLAALGTEAAIGRHELVELAWLREQVRGATGSETGPGRRLHVLAVGVSEYQAEHLRLKYAAQDAIDLSEALFLTQGELYARVDPWRLTNSEATAEQILRGLRGMRERMAEGDVAIVHFSGHGISLGEDFFLAPYEIDVSAEFRIRRTGLDIKSFRRELDHLAERGTAVVLLDACRSGAATRSGRPLYSDAGRLAEELKSPSIALLTSSSAGEIPTKTSAGGMAHSSKPP